MLSIKKAFRFIFQPTTFILAFIWMLFYTTAICLYLKMLLNAFFSGNVFQLFGSIYRWGNVYGITLLVICFLTFMYLLIVAKKYVFENPPKFSFSFFIRKSLILFPFIMAYSLILNRLLPSLGNVNNLGKIGLGFIVIILSYLFWNFVVSFLEHFNFTSVRRLFLSALKKPYLILQFWGYMILTGIFLHYTTRYLIMGVKAFMKDLLPALTPCGTGTGVIVTLVFIFVFKMLFDAFNRTGRLFLIVSLIFALPSLFIQYMFPFPINTLLFLIIMQIFWYVNYFCVTLLIGATAFLCHILAQITRRISNAGNPQPLPGSDIHVQNLL